jgi:hypothetical protein
MTLNRLLTTTALMAALAVSPFLAGQAQAQVGAEVQTEAEVQAQIGAETEAQTEAELQAQSDAQTGVQPGAQIDGAAIAADDSKIDAFIEAALAVAETRQGYVAQLEATTDEAEQMAIVQAADAAILEVVEAAEGITVEEYIAIGEAATTDAELAARIDARFAEAHADG